MRSRRKLALMSVSAALLIVAALSGLILSRLWRNDPNPINMPSVNISPGTQADSIPVPIVSFEPYDILDVNSANVKLILAALPSGEDGSFGVVSTWYWDGSSSQKRYNVIVSGATSTIDEIGTDGELVSTVTVDEERYIFSSLDGSPVYEGVRGNFSAYDVCALPSGAALQYLSEDAILGIDYAETELGRCLELYTSEDVYTGHYIISIDSGMLLQAFFRDENDNLAFSSEITVP